MAEEKKQEQQVETIIEEEYVEVPSKWTFLKYIKSIARFKWWIIGFTLFGAVAGYLGFRFILNPMKKTLSTEYTYDLAGKYTDSDTMSFIDGTLFNPYELTNRDNLQKVKDSNEKYASVNIDKLVSDNAIVISKTAKPLNDKDVTGTVEINYVISCKASYFKNDNLGKDFIYDVINLAKNLSTNAINNYEARLVFSNNYDSLTLDRQIGLLDEQYNAIKNSYNELVSTFSPVTTCNENGTKLNELITSFESQYYVSGVSSFTEILIGQKDANKYVNYVIGEEDAKIEEIHSLCTSYIQTIKNNNKNIDVLEERLDKLLSSVSIIGSDTNVSAQITSLNNEITNLMLSNTEITKELNNNGYFLNDQGEFVFNELDTNTTIYKLTQKDANWVSSNTAFSNSIKEYKNRLIDNNDVLAETYKYCYSQYKNKINIQNGGYVTLSGSISSWIGAAIGLVAGFVVTSLITAIIYVYKEEK